MHIEQKQNSGISLGVLFFRLPCNPCGCESYGHCLTQHRLPNRRFKRVFHHQIHFNTQRIREIVFHADEDQQAGVFAKGYQYIQVAAQLLLTAHVGTEDFQRFDTVALRKQWFCWRRMVKKVSSERLPTIIRLYNTLASGVRQNTIKLFCHASLNSLLTKLKG